MHTSCNKYLDINMLKSPYIPWNFLFMSANLLRSLSSSMPSCVIFNSWLDCLASSCRFRSSSRARSLKAINSIRFQGSIIWFQGLTCIVLIAAWLLHSNRQTHALRAKWTLVYEPLMNYIVKTQDYLDCG